MSDEKVQSILELEAPRNVKDVRAFLGFANFYHRFIEGYLRICKPMTDTTKTTDPTGGIKKFQWTKEYAAAFTELKVRFTAASILRHFDPSLPCIVETDASDFAIGAVLSQVHSKKLHPMAFYSRKMDKPEVNYDIHDCHGPWARQVAEGGGSRLSGPTGARGGEGGGSR